MLSTPSGKPGGNHVGATGTTLRFPLAQLNLAAPPWRASAEVSSRRRRPRAGGMFPPGRPPRHRFGGPILAAPRRVDAAGRAAGRRPDQRPRWRARSPSQAEAGRRLGLREYGAAGGGAVVRRSTVVAVGGHLSSDPSQAALRVYGAGRAPPAR